MRCFSTMQLSSAVLEMIDSPALSFRDAQKICNVKLDVEYASILRTAPVPKPLITIISPRKQKETEALGKRNSKRLFLLLRKSLSSAVWECFVCFFIPPSFLFSLFHIYLFLDWVGRKQHYFGTGLFLNCSLLLVTFNTMYGKIACRIRNYGSNCVCSPFPGFSWCNTCNFSFKNTLH